MAYLAEEVRKVEDAGADMLHLDVMDGHFVPNLTIGPFVVEAVKRVASVPLDVHLMIEHPAKYADPFAKAGADIITFHVEAKDEPSEVISLLKDLGVRAGIVISPDPPANAIEAYADKVEMVLVMTVYPGFAGQKFISKMLPKIEEVRRIIGSEKDLEVDGGITTENVRSVYDAGANVIVAGTTIFGSTDMGKTISELRNAAK